MKAELVKLEKEYKAAEAGLRACEEGSTDPFGDSECGQANPVAGTAVDCPGRRVGGSPQALEGCRLRTPEDRERMEHLREEIKDSPNKLKTAHTRPRHYAPGYGWLWTSPKHYPQIYSNARQGWVYYEQGTMEPWLYYDYQLEQWEEWFLDAPFFSSSN